MYVVCIFVLGNLFEVNYSQNHDDGKRSRRLIKQPVKKKQQHTSIQTKRSFFLSETEPNINEVFEGVLVNTRLKVK